MKYCTKCGAQMEDNDFACSRCGFSGQSAPNTPPNQGYNPNNQGITLTIKAAITRIINKTPMTLPVRAMVFSAAYSQ